MSSSTTKLGDDLLRVPKLDVAGINWVVYKDRFLWSVDGPHPHPPIPTGTPAPTGMGFP